MWKPLFATVLVVAPWTVVSAQEKRPVSQRGQERLVREVGHELVTQPYYGVFDHLAYKVEGGKVTLVGYVTRPSLKQSAEGAVYKIEGVESVDNQIEVLPPSTMDDQIRQAMYQTIYGNPGLNRYSFRAVPPIHIIADGGNVTLYGAVATQLDKQLAYSLARSVPGVFDVKNQLIVEQSDQDKDEKNSQGGSDKADKSARKN